MHFHRRTRVGWRVLPVPSRPGTASDSLASLRCPWPWVALIASLWLSTQRQLSRWFLVWVTTRRVHTANLDKPCKQRKDSNYSQLFSNTTKHNLKLSGKTEAELAQYVGWAKRSALIGFSSAWCRLHVSYTLRYDWLIELSATIYSDISADDVSSLPPISIIRPTPMSATAHQ